MIRQIGKLLATSASDNIVLFIHLQEGTPARIHG